MESLSSSCSRVVLLTFFWLLLLLGRSRNEQLDENFYNNTCPNVEVMVREALMAQPATTIPATLRLFFHDCFVEGCDTSILLQSPYGNAEKDARPNLSIAAEAFQTITRAKQSIEAACPGIVSCSDILAIAARDVVALSGGPSYKVELGRRDGLVSLASRVHENLPHPHWDLTRLNSLFSRNNLTQVDMIALSGAHTIGISHCVNFVDRLYSNRSGSGSSSIINDTSLLDQEYARQLMQICPPYFHPNSFAMLDHQTPRAFDNQYYKNLLAGRGLLMSDEVLFADTRSRATVESFSLDAQLFTESFIQGMKKLGRVGVKTGNNGEIRHDCTAINNYYF